MLDHLSTGRQAWPQLMIRVFIQHEAGSDQKHIHDEKTLEYKRTVTVSRPYPFPYGFILDSTSEDGDNLDCFVITEQPLKTGMLVECEPIALLEQIEDGEEDHNVLAALPGETPEIDQAMMDTFREFTLHVFDHVPGKQIAVGKLFPREAAEAHIRASSDKS